MLKDKTALLRFSAVDSTSVLAQFDDLGLGPSYSHSWRKYPRSYWELKEPVDWDDVDG